MSDITYRHLADMPAALPELEQIFTTEWAGWYGPGGPGNAHADLTAAAQRNTLPLALVAVEAHTHVLGCAMLKTQSIGAELGYGPFLAGFVVAPAARCRGVGTGLVFGIEIMARNLGFNAVFGATDSAGGILVRRGWQAVDRAPSSRGEMVIYKLNLSSHPASGS